MGRLPSQYDAINYAATQATESGYVDTGIVPSSTLTIEGKFHFGWQSDVNVYMFGARNTNSNTSAGQITFEYVASGTSYYVGYYNARTKVVGGRYLYLKKGEATTFGGSAGATTDIATNDFTGTRNMYIYARNNGGTAQPGNTPYGRGVYGLKIWDNDVLIRDYIPCYNKTTSACGLYEAVNGVFSQIGDTRLIKWLDIRTSGNGKAFAKTDNAGDVTRFGVAYDSYSLFDAYQDNTVRICAEPSDGYDFLHWLNGSTVISNERDTKVQITSATTLTAVFVKKTSSSQYNGFNALGLQYGQGIQNLSAYDGLQYNLFGRIKTAKIKEDIMSRTTSTIEMIEMPSLYQNDMPLFVRDSRGKTVYGGIIKGINGNSITCREPLSIVDGDIVLNTPNYNLDFTVNARIRSIIDLYLFGWPIIKTHTNDGANPLFANNNALRRKGEPYLFAYDNYVYFDLNKNYITKFPSIDGVSVGNLEEFILNLANQYVICFKPSIYTYASTKKSLMRVEAINPYVIDKITFGNNSEEITNVSIDVEDTEATILQVFNTAATTLRGIFGIKNDGTVEELPTNYSDLSADFLCYNNCKLKILCSDEKLGDLKTQYLSNAFYNHKITFDVDLTKGTFKFDDFSLGRRVDFYYGNKVYNSIISAREYQINENSDVISSLKVTLGKVRTNLTNKLNLSVHK